MNKQEAIDFLLTIQTRLSNPYENVKMRKIIDWVRSDKSD